MKVKMIVSIASKDEQIYLVHVDLNWHQLKEYISIVILHLYRLKIVFNTRNID